MFPKAADQSAAKQLGLEGNYTIVYAARSICHVASSSEVAEKIYKRLNNIDPNDEWDLSDGDTIDCIEGWIDEKTISAMLPDGWFLVEVAEPDGDNYRPGKFGMVYLGDHIEELNHACSCSDAIRYRKLRNADLDTIEQGGIFVGKTPDNIVISGEDLDQALEVQ